VTGPRVDPLGILEPEKPDQQQDPLGLLAPAGATPKADPGGDIDLRTSGAPSPTPAPRPATAGPAPLPADHPAAQPGFVDRFKATYDHFVDAANQWRDELVPTETRTPAQPIDRRTVTQQAAAARAQGSRLIQSAASADVSGTPGAQILPSPGGTGVTTAAAMDASQTMANIKATAEVQGRFSPQEWMDIADRGMKLGSALHAQGKHDEADDVLRKAYNAQLLASGAKQADTFGAIALSNLLGIVKDPYAGQRRNMAAIRANPDLTFTPEEQQSMLGRNLPVGTDRNFEVSKDVVAPLVGMAPAFEAGGFIGRGAAGIAGAAAERAGYEGIGSMLGRAAQLDEVPTALGPRVPLASPRLVGTRLEEEVAALRQQLPHMVTRGATQGQVVGAIQNYRMARQQGATPEQALQGAVEGAALNIPMGIGAEVGLGLAGRALNLTYDPIGRVWREARDRVRGTSPEEAVTTPLPPTPAVDAARAQEGKLPTSDMLPGMHRDIAHSLEELLGRKRTETQRGYEDIFAQPHPDETPAGPDFWNARVETGDVPRFDVGDQPLGPDEPARENLIERPSVIGGRRREPPTPEPIPSALEAAMRRAGVDPAIRPSDEANAHFTMRRAAMDAEEHGRIAAEEAQRALDDPNLRLEMAAQQRPGEAQGPRTLEETLADTKEKVAAGDPLATEYHDAINRYVDAAAAVRDAGEGGANTRSQIALARARSALDAARTKYGKQIGASAVLALAANNSDLSDEEKKMVGLGGLAILSTDVVPYENHPLTERVPFTSRLKSAIDALPKKWDNAAPAADWIGKLKGTTTFRKEELALILPALEEAQRGKVKLTRDDVRAIAAERLPKIDRITLAEGGGRPEVSGDAHAGDVDDIHDIDTVLADIAAPHANDPEGGQTYLQEQIDNRAARIAEIESAIEERTDEAHSQMQYAEQEQTRAEREIKRTLEKYEVDRTAADDAIQYLDENVEHEYIPRDAIDKALMMAIENGDLRTAKSPESLFEDHGWSVKEETKRPFTAEFTEADGTHHVEEMEYEGDETPEQVKQHLSEEFGVKPEDIEITDHDEETEYVAYDYNDHEQGRGEDKDDLMQEMVNDHGLDSDANDELYSELKSDLETYAQARAEWMRAESEHYYMTEGEHFSEEHEEIDKLKEEMEQIEAARQELADRPIADIPNARALPEVAGQETGRPEGEPVAVVEAPDHEEPEQNVIPEVHGAPKYASYQRIGGGKNYREMLNVWSNNPGEDYKRNHYGNQGYQNVVGHVRAEDHQVYADLPGVSHDKVEISGDDPEPVRILKSHIVEVRKNRDKLIEQMNAVVRQHADLNEPEGIEAQDLARKYGDLNQRVIDLSKREDELDGKLSSALLNAGQGVHMDTQNVAVMIESQADWAQDAAKYGVKDPTAQTRFNEIGGRMREVEAEMDLIESDAGLTSPHATPRWKELSAQLAELRDQQEAIREAGNGNMVPTSPFIETQQAFTLNAARFLMDAAERGHEVAAWSDAANRVKNAHLPMQAAKLVYDQITPSAMTKLLNAVGFKDVPIRKMYIRGEGHWAIDLTPEMRKAIKRAGLPLLGAAAMMATPEQAQAQGGGPTTGDLYTTALGGIAAGAALMYLAQNRKVRRLVKENREFERALMLDDLSGLANKRAFSRALPSVNADEKYHWVVFDGDRFKKLNDTHGHAEGDKAIQHFGKSVMDVAEQMDIPMRGFRFGGDEIAFAAPVEHAAEFMRRVEEASRYTKGDVTTKLTGGMGPTFDVADAALNATKQANRDLDPSLRRTPGTPPRPPAGEGGATLYANPIGPAMRELMRYPGAAALAGVGALATQSDDKDIKATGAPLIALAALSTIGARRIGAAKDFLADKLLQQMQKVQVTENTNAAQLFNPDALLHPDVRKAIIDFEEMRAKGAARANEFSGRAKELGPSGDRAVSDVIENENWEDVSAMSPKDMTAVLTFAAALEKEYSDLAAQKVKHGVLDPLQLLPGYAGPRRYAHYEAADVLAERRAGNGGGGSTRIGAQKSRTLDEPIRDAQRELAAAQASGDKQRISDAQDALDQAHAVQMSQRVERGEIRESSYRAAQGIQKGYNDVAAAKLFEHLRAQPGVAHPEWVRRSMISRPPGRCAPPRRRPPIAQRPMGSCATRRSRSTRSPGSTSRREATM
jgi:diguanylate cyclase (GGDEF)-like protein